MIWRTVSFPSPPPTMFFLNARMEEWCLKILTWKIYPQIKLKRLRKVSKYENMYIWVIGTLDQLFIRSSYTQIKFSEKWSSSHWQKSILCDRSIFLLPIQFVVTLAFDRAVLYGNVALLFVVLWTKWYSSFLRKVFAFQKTYFKWSYWKRSKNTPVIVTYKHADLLNAGLF